MSCKQKAKNHKSFKKIQHILIVTFLFFIQTSVTYANLLLTPTRIEFDQRERSAKVSLVNTGNKTKTYKIFWRQQKQLNDGQYYHFQSEEEIADFPTADKMLRFSPRQVTLAPGERQYVRIALRRPKDLAEGEYRSHLVFEAQPDREEEKARAAANTSGIKLYLNLAFAIPVIVREGSLNVDTEFSKIELLTKKVKGKQHLGANLYLKKSGPHSTVGNVKVYWTDLGGSTERQIGILNNIAIYPEVNLRKIAIGFKDHTIKPGTLRVVYQGSEELEGITFIDHKLTVNPTDYKPAPMSK
ncbi:fimbrial biogenesis chaperone [Thalassotalea profundi]|uniref:Molecular chaperone n=1 Tax=Thalassotalea profundi TaxID=2036687 RepID=A0ABQ3J3N4_9GAMM|nr:fimbria/pilus periplasmic chaperone [Thalassotalea profundi]GHF00295.1 hypothetical protein GCM10011501_32270 [Thalassotalea profundi]